MLLLHQQAIGGHGESRTLNASVQAKQYPVYLHAHKFLAREDGLEPPSHRFGDEHISRYTILSLPQS